MTKDITINGVTVRPGESAQVSLNTYRLPTRTVIDIPVFVYRSLEDGPVVLLLAGMHGDEINGVEIIRSLIVNNTFSKLHKGTVIAIPVINIVSFVYGTRSLPDGRDLNRCFPGSIGGSLGSRIAHDLMSEIIPQISFGVDFHTGGASKSNFPQIRCSFGALQNLELAEQFGSPFIINSGLRDKTLRKEAANIGKTILVYEGGESSRFDQLAIKEGIDGCKRLFVHLKMIEAKTKPGITKLIQKTTWVRAKNSGLFHPVKKNGAFVKKNELLGTVTDPYGEFETEIIASASGYIIGINNLPVINRGDALIHIGISI
ncbi:MAG: succinylglutamate desuccinylase/aspartoacylase family protein [Bacteroidetes bacterium]|nr:succinylglutamate desuccinylase/aspartoacylase family protein [Bacteroidota bacterium]HET6244582.1 succinylglutamate desuccinylase/aspartoacylase family protein [Bacteroidia bacterium]